MGILTEIWTWIAANYTGFFIVLMGLILVAESIARLTPTLKDDSAVERVGAWVRWVMDLLKIPNVTIKDGKLGVHEKRKDE